MTFSGIVEKFFTILKMKKVIVKLINERKYKFISFSFFPRVKDHHVEKGKVALFTLSFDNWLCFSRRES